jgi:hypothetical protein
VPVYYCYLPSYFTDFDLALKKAQETLGESAVLKKVYFMGVKGQYFEFAGSGGKALLHASSLEHKDAKELHPDKSLVSVSQLSATEMEDAMARDRAMLADDWKRIISEIAEQ